MPLITTINNRNTAILNDLQSTLSQIKVSGITNLRLLVPEGTATVSFYVDKAKTNLLFTGSYPTHFATVNGKLYYTPPDSLMNNATGLSATFCQPEYYVTITNTDSSTTDTIYRNSANLLFQQVIVASKGQPEYAGNANVCSISVCPETQEGLVGNNDYRWALLTFDLTLFLNVLDIASLSEYDRIAQYQLVSNVIRDALMADRYRNGNSALYDKDTDGTSVGELKPLPSKDRLKGTMKVKCQYYSLPTSY